MFVNMFHKSRDAIGTVSEPGWMVKQASPERQGRVE